LIIKINRGREEFIKDGFFYFKNKEYPITIIPSAKDYIAFARKFPG